MNQFRNERFKSTHCGRITCRSRTLQHSNNHKPTKLTTKHSHLRTHYTRHSHMRNTHIQCARNDSPFGSPVEVSILNGMKASFFEKVIAADLS